MWSWCIQHFKGYVNTINFMPSIKLVSELSEKFQGLGRQLTFEIYIELFTVTFYVAIELYPGMSLGKNFPRKCKVCFPNHVDMLDSSPRAEEPRKSQGAFLSTFRLPSLVSAVTSNDLLRESLQCNLPGPPLSMYFVILDVENLTWVSTPSSTSESMQNFPLVMLSGLCFLYWELIDVANYLMPPSL